MIYLAFYKGRTTDPWHKVQDAIIRATTRSDYSHVELVLTKHTPEPGEHFVCISASGRDGGVRRKPIMFKPGHWDFVPVPWVRYGNAVARAESYLGAKYDYRALLLSHVIRFNAQSEKRLMCSEFAARVLGFDRAHTFSPGDLFSVVQRVNAVYTGRTDR